MTAYDLSPWTDLFVMAGGASAALAGLLFVAVSLNLEHVLSYRSLPALAGQVASVLVAIVLLSVLALAPQPVPVFGAEVLVLGVVLSAVVLVPTVIGLRRVERTAWAFRRLATSIPSVLPMLVGGISLVLGAGGGIYWLLAEVVLGIALSAYGAWILLVEIRR